MKSSECFTIDVSVQQDKPLVKKDKKTIFALNKANGGICSIRQL